MGFYIDPVILMAVILALLSVTPSSQSQLLYFLFLLKSKYYYKWKVDFTKNIIYNLYNLARKKVKKQEGTIFGFGKTFGFQWTHLSHRGIRLRKCFLCLFADMVLITSRSMPLKMILAGIENLLWNILFLCFQRWKIDAWATNFPENSRALDELSLIQDSNSDQFMNLLIEGLSLVRTSLQT